MNAIFNKLLKPFNALIGIMLLILLTACNVTDEVADSDATLPQSDAVTQVEIEEAQSTIGRFDNFEDYIDYLADIPSFEPYYKTTFAFEELSGGISSVPIENVKSMYNEMNKLLDYINISDYPLVYKGHYGRDKSFVEGFEEYQSAEISNPVNVLAHDWDGKQILTTPLKTILLGESIFNQFNDSIEKGRNLQKDDFTLASPNEPISIVLGNAYKDIYEIGDTLDLELISKVMKFKVVGFYKPNVGFSNDIGALNQVNFDHTIVMPHFIPKYEPVGEAEIFQHAFHIAELTSGYIKISESIENINDDTYNEIVNDLEEIANRNNLSKNYIVPYWPVGFVW